MKLHTNCSLSAEIYIDENRNYFFLVYDGSTGKERWFGSSILESEGEKAIEDARKEIEP